jgi:hypothetical protein
MCKYLEKKEKRRENSFHLRRRREYSFWVNESYEREKNNKYKRGVNEVFIFTEES